MWKFNVESKQAYSFYLQEYLLYGLRSDYEI
jgi:hypothetical protein